MAAPPTGKPPLANGRPSSAGLSGLVSNGPSSNGLSDGPPAPRTPAPASAKAAPHAPPAHAHHAHHDEVGGTGTLTPPFVTALTTMAR